MLVSWNGVAEQGWIPEDSDSKRYNSKFKCSECYAMPSAKQPSVIVYYYVYTYSKSSALNLVGGLKNRKNKREGE